jgi:hypothetical protein
MPPKGTMDAFALSNHDLLLRYAWEMKTTKERWEALKSFRAQIGEVFIPAMPSEIEDRFWDAIREMMLHLMGGDERIGRYLYDTNASSRVLALADGTDHPDEWLLTEADEATAFAALRPVEGLDEIMTFRPLGNPTPTMITVSPEWDASTPPAQAHADDEEAAA